LVLHRFVSEAKRRFDLWASGKDTNAIHTNLRSVIFSVNVSEGGHKEYDAVKEEYIRTDSVDGKEICLSALGRTKDASLVKDYLNFVFSDKVAIQDIHSGAVSLAANSKVRNLLWEYIKATGLLSKHDYHLTMLCLSALSVWVYQSSPITGSVTTLRLSSRTRKRGL
jgi:hypothetical protein